MNIKYDKKNVEFQFSFYDKPTIIECNKWLDIKSNLLKVKYDLASLPNFYFFEMFNFKTKFSKGHSYASGVLIIFDEQLLYGFMEKFNIGDPVYYKLRFGGDER